jgi:hypothetical protein
MRSKVPLAIFIGVLVLSTGCRQHQRPVATVDRISFAEIDKLRSMSPKALATLVKGILTRPNADRLFLEGNFTGESKYNWSLTSDGALWNALFEGRDRMPRDVLPAFVAICRNLVEMIRNSTLPNTERSRGLFALERGFRTCVGYVKNDKLPLSKGLLDALNISLFVSDGLKFPINLDMDLDHISKRLDQVESELFRL